MKESTGELSMVVITIIAVIAILAIWNAVKDPLSDWVTGKFGQMEDSADKSAADAGL